MTPASDQKLRDWLVAQLRFEYAHIGFSEAIADWPSKLRGVRPLGAKHSAWEILEHLRIAQWDILEFSQNADHVSPEFPAGYWPSEAVPQNDSEWEDSVEKFNADLRSMQDLILNPASDLYAVIPHGDGQTLFRESLTLASHNSYHIGQLVLLKGLL